MTAPAYAGRAPTETPWHAELMRVRRGEPTLDEIIDELHAATARLEHALVRADIPEEPDRDAVDRYLIAAHEQVWFAG